ncbi:hypothetical protein SAMN03159406_00932 [Rhizobium sp. NFR03]|nr:hypothetical protein SAMN03159406_00932 [Rhizobium sp. NFR03]
MQKKMMSRGREAALLRGHAAEEKKKMTKKFLKKELSRDRPVRGAIERVV